MLRRLLSSPSIDACAEIASGEAAVLWMEGNAADVVIMDIHMPGIGGIEATRVIKRSNPAATTFGFTGWGSEDVDAMFEAGASAAFAKRKVPDLLDVIKNV